MKMTMHLASAIRELDHWIQANAPSGVEYTWINLYHQYLNTSLTPDAREALVGYYIDLAEEEQIALRNKTVREKPMLIPVNIESEDEFTTIFQQDTAVCFCDDITDTNVYFYPKTLAILLYSPQTIKQFNKTSLEEFTKIATYYHRFRKPDNKDAKRFNTFLLQPSSHNPFQSVGTQE